jgi:dephospho-CoA kinase
MLIIGLTGGVGCGKSAVAKLFRERGAPIIDADVITRELVARGSPVLPQITEAFGAGVLQPDGELHRRALRRIVFERPEARRRLEAILHPRVRAEIVARVQRLSAPYCVVVIPLLVESRMTDLVDRVLVVDCDEAQQIARVSARDHCSEDEVRSIIATQAARETRLAAANDVLLNAGELPDLAAGVRRLHERYLALAGA